MKGRSWDEIAASVTDAEIETWGREARLTRGANALMREEGWDAMPDVSEWPRAAKRWLLKAHKQHEDIFSLGLFLWANGANATIRRTLLLAEDYVDGGFVEGRYNAGAKRDIEDIVQRGERRELRGRNNATFDRTLRRGETWGITYEDQYGFQRIKKLNGAPDGSEDEYVKRHFV